MPEQGDGEEQSGSWQILRSEPQQAKVEERSKKCSQVTTRYAMCTAVKDNPAGFVGFPLTANARIGEHGR